MKILRIIARLNVGGPARHVVLLDKGLRARGHQTLLVHGAVDRGEGDLERLAVEAGVPTLKLSSLGRRVHPLKDAGALVRLVYTTFREAPDIIHTHTAKAGALGRIAAFVFNATRRRRSRCVVVHTFHGHVLDGYFNPAVSGLVCRVERLLARVTDRIVTISPAQRDDIVDRYRIGGSERTVVVPLGLELRPSVSDADAGPLRAELGLAEHSIVFGFVGRLVPIKDVPTLLLAFERLLQTIPDAYLLLAGDGPTRPDVQALIADRALASHVRLLGWREDLARIYAAMDVCVLSSRNEGTPVALIEAMQAGRPIIATRVGGVPDVVADGDTGLLVGPGDVEALAGAMATLARDPALRSRLGQLGRERTARQFGSERLVDDIATLYENALEERRC